MRCAEACGRLDRLGASVWVCENVIGDTADVADARAAWLQRRK